MGLLSSLVTFFFVLCLSTESACYAATARKSNTSKDLVRSSCVHASYPNVCLRTLSSFGGQAKSPTDLALTAVTVSLSRARSVSGYLTQVGSVAGGSKRENGAVSDCIEQISESVDELSRTLSELKHLRSGTFRWQMSNAQTWVSAALTNEDTCLDGFDSVGGKVKADIRRKMGNVAKVTSNALYLISRLQLSRGRKGHL